MAALRPHAPTASAPRIAPTPRIACVSLPRIGVAVEERDDNTLVGRPIAMTAVRESGTVVVEVSPVAAAIGLAPGMPAAQARQLCPDLVLRPLRQDACREAFRAMLGALAEFTSVVEPVDLDRSWLAVGGLAGAGNTEDGLMREITRRIHAATGLVARAGVAHGKLTSRIVTQYLESRDVMVLPPGCEVPFLGGLATRYLPLPARTLEELRALGVTKVRAYAALPAAGILPRFGYAGLRAYRLAHGQDDPRVQPWMDEPYFEARHSFAEPIANSRSLRYRIEQLAREVAAPLAERYRMAGEISLTIAFARGETVTRRRTLLEPAGSARVLAGHAEAIMGEIGWQAPVLRIEIAVRGLCMAPARQLALFRQAEEAEAGAEAALERIQARFGAGAVRQGRRADPDSSLHERRAVTVPWQRRQG